jgi:hypothetical protein
MRTRRKNICIVCKIDRYDHQSRKYSHSIEETWITAIKILSFHGSSLQYTVKTSFRFNDLHFILLTIYPKQNDVSKHLFRGCRVTNGHDNSNILLVLFIVRLLACFLLTSDILDNKESPHKIHSFWMTRVVNNKGPRRIWQLCWIEKISSQFCRAVRAASNSI